MYYRLCSLWPCMHLTWVQQLLLLTKMVWWENSNIQIHAFLSANAQTHTLSKFLDKSHVRFMLHPTWKQFWINPNILQIGCLSGSGTVVTFGAAISACALFFLAKFMVGECYKQKRLFLSVVGLLFGYNIMGSSGWVFWWNGTTHWFIYSDRCVVVCKYFLLSLYTHVIHLCLSLKFVSGYVGKGLGFLVTYLSGSRSFQKDSHVAK